MAVQGVQGAARPSVEPRLDLSMDVKHILLPPRGAAPRPSQVLSRPFALLGKIRAHGDLSEDCRSLKEVHRFHLHELVLDQFSVAILQHPLRRRGCAWSNLFLPTESHDATQ